MVENISQIPRNINLLKTIYYKIPTKPIICFSPVKFYSQKSFLPLISLIGWTTSWAKTIFSYPNLLEIDKTSLIKINDGRNNWFDFICHNLSNSLVNDITEAYGAQILLSNENNKDLFGLRERREWKMIPPLAWFKKLGKCATIVTVNLKMDTYNSGKFKGTKSYTVKQNKAKVTYLLDIVKRTFSRHGLTISKWRVIHLRVQYVDGALFFQMGLYFFRWLRRR